MSNQLKPNSAYLDRRYELYDRPAVKQRQKPNPAYLNRINGLYDGLTEKQKQKVLEDDAIKAANEFLFSRISDDGYDDTLYKSDIIYSLVDPAQSMILHSLGYDYDYINEGDDYDIRKDNRFASKNKNGEYPLHTNKVLNTLLNKAFVEMRKIYGNPEGFLVQYRNSPEARARYEQWKRERGK